jgi:predicted nuclease with TOPRIM domain
MKEESTTTNEEIKSVQEKFFCILNEIHRNKDDYTRLEDKMEEIRDKYENCQDAFDIIMNWQSVYKNPLDAIPLYTTRHKKKYQLLFDT